MAKNSLTLLVKLEKLIFEKLEKRIHSHLLRNLQFLFSKNLKNVFAYTDCENLKGLFSELSQLSGCIRAGINLWLNSFFLWVEAYKHHFLHFHRAPKPNHKTEYAAIHWFWRISYRKMYLYQLFRRCEHCEFWESFVLSHLYSFLPEFKQLRWNALFLM